MRTSGPEDAVRALFEVEVAGEDPSIHATGDLARVLRLQYEIEQGIEIAARRVEFKAVRVRNLEGDEARVYLDAVFHAAIRQRDGTWQASSSHCRGTAAVRRAEGIWRVVDYPWEGHSMLRSLLELGAVQCEGSLELDLAGFQTAKRTVFVFRLHNVGDVPVELVRFSIRQSFLGWALDLSVPLLWRVDIAPAESYDSHVPMKFWPKRGRVGFLATDPGGRTHSAALDFRRSPHADEKTRLAAAGHLPGGPELLALAVGIALASTRWPLVAAGGLLVLAAVIRGAFYGSFALLGSRGHALTIVLALTAVELALGTVLMLARGLSWTVFVIWLSTVALLVSSLNNAWKRRRSIAT